MSKAAGVTEPTADEKDPAFLAMQVKALIGTVNKLVQTQQENLQSIYKAFAMSDAHLQVLSRVTRDLTTAVQEARRMQVDGDVTAAEGDLGDIKLRDGALDMGAYYAEYRAVGEKAGPTADTALVFWSQGYSVEEAVARATLNESESVDQGEKESSPDYEIEHFGGNVSGQNHHKQDAQEAHAGG